MLILGLKFVLQSPTEIVDPRNGVPLLSLKIAARATRQQVYKKLYENASSTIALGAIVAKAMLENGQTTWTWLQEHLRGYLPCA